MKDASFSNRTRKVERTLSLVIALSLIVLTVALLISGTPLGETFWVLVLGGAAVAALPFWKR